MEKIYSTLPKEWEKKTKQPQQVTGQVSHTSQVKQPIWILQIFGFSWKEIGIMCLACSQWSVKTNRFGSFPVIIRDFAIRKHLFQTVSTNRKNTLMFRGVHYSSGIITTTIIISGLPVTALPELPTEVQLFVGHFVQPLSVSWRSILTDALRGKWKITRDRDQMTLNLWPSQLPPPEKRV